jgi:WD40 repeat protein
VALFGAADPVIVSAGSSSVRTARLVTVGEGDETAPPGELDPPTRDPSIPGGRSWVYAVAARADGTVAYAPNLTAVQLWDAADPAHPRPLATVSSSPPGSPGFYVLSLGFSPHGDVLATAGTDEVIRLWNVADRRHPTPLGPLLQGHAGAVRSVTFSPDGHTLASASDDETVRLWDVGDPRRPRPIGRPLAKHSAPVKSVAFSPDGGTLASAGSDHTVLLWDVSDRGRPRPLATLTGHTDAVLSVAFSPDGKTLASASYDGTVRTWDVDNPRRPTQAAVLGGPGSVSFQGVAFSPDGKTIAAAAPSAGVVVLWNVDPEAVAARVCSLVGEFTPPEEWRRGYKGVPYPCH